MVDYMIWPWFERLVLLSDFGYVLNADGKLPKLAAWVKAMLANEAVKKIKVPEETMKKFAKTARDGKADYDIE
jgi:glutathione S-transferase